MTYCGCGTKANKIRWALALGLLALAVVFLIANFIAGRDCQVCEDVTNSNGITVRECDVPTFGDWGEDNIEGCSEGAVSATSFLFLICAIAATIPCCCMCCCASPPRKEVQYDVAIVAKPEGQQQTGGPYYAQTPYGQPQPQGQTYSAPGPPVV